MWLVTLLVIMSVEKISFGDHRKLPDISGYRCKLLKMCEELLDVVVSEVRRRLELRSGPAGCSSAFRA